jgi:hypothetical protein
MTILKDGDPVKSRLLMSQGSLSGRMLCGVSVGGPLATGRPDFHKFINV